MNDQIIERLLDIIERDLLSNPEGFTIEKYEDFLQKTWDLKEEFGLENNPLVFLPEPAHTAYYEMMADSMDYFMEPSQEATDNYLAKMRLACDKIKRSK